MHDDDLTGWIAQLYAMPEMLLMGHNQRADDLNLGLGWIYYALGRLARPATVVVIGSYRGFAPLVFARALRDNSEDGKVVFIDPSMVDDFWADAANVRQHFASFGLTNVEHHQMTTQEFVKSDAFAVLGESACCSSMAITRPSRLGSTTRRFATCSRPTRSRCSTTA